MGYDCHKITVHYRLSAHNSPRDGEDRDAAANLRMEIDALIKSTPEYQRIVSDIWGGDH